MSRPAARFRTGGQERAVATIRRLAAAGMPHALLFVGPAGVGKTTLALDLAAVLLCTAPDASARPCRDCRACRLIEHGNHPDVHRLAPGGTGHQIRIGATSADPRPGVRELVEAMSLLPAEGRARIAIVESAHRMNEDAQNALLKLLEEPPPGVHLVLCADDEDRLLPTIRSRCVRIRLGRVGGRAIEEILVERGLADPPTAASLGRLAAGRPGAAAAYAASPTARTARAEIDRAVLDLLSADVTNRLVESRRLLTRAGDLDRSLSGQAEAADRGEPGSRDDAPSERRRAALALAEAWRVVGLELTRAASGESGGCHDPSLIDEISAAAPEIPAGSLGRFLGRLDAVARSLIASGSPELAVDVLALAWPRRQPRRSG